MKLMSSKFHT